MIDVYDLANSAVQEINPDGPALFYASDGYEIGTGRRQVPKYKPAQSVLIQEQGVSARALAHLHSLNIQGVLRSVHIRANAQGVVRVNRRGGDLLYFPELPGGTPYVWKVVQVLETWPTWARVIVNLQTDLQPPQPPAASGG